RRRIPWSGLRLGHCRLLKSACQVERFGNVATLRGLVSAGEKDDPHSDALHEIHAITRTVVDPHFRHALAHRLHVAGISNLESIDAGLDARSRTPITQVCEPMREELSLSDLDHRRLYPMGY